MLIVLTYIGAHVHVSISTAYNHDMFTSYTCPELNNTPSVPERAVPQKKLLNILDTLLFCFTNYSILLITNTFHIMHHKT